MDGRIIEELKGELKKVINHRTTCDKDIQRIQRMILKELPASLGYASVDELIDALMPLASAEFRQARPGSTPAQGARRRRRSLDESTKARIRHALESGQSMSAIARSEGISLATVSRLKGSLGLVKHRTGGSSRGVSHRSTAGEPAAQNGADGTRSILSPN